MPMSQMSSINPIRPSRDRPDRPKPVAVEPDVTPPRANAHLPVEVVLDLGTGLDPMVYAEYTRHSELGVVSIRIVDPTTGNVIREYPNAEVLEFTESLVAYADLGRRGSAPSTLA